MRFAMRRLALVAATGGLGCVLALAGCGKPATSPGSTTPTTTAADPNAPPQKKPKAVVDQAEYNFGVAQVGQQFEHTFTITNKGDADLTMVKGAPSCSTCTSFEVDKLHLAPGESAKANVKWKVSNAREQFRQYAPLMTNDPDQPEIKLVVVGEISEMLKLLPSTTWNIQDLNDTKPTEATGTLASSVVDSFKIVSVESSDPSLTTTVTPLDEDELKELKAKCGYQIRAAVAPNVPIGDYKQHFNIKTDVGDNGPIEVTVVGKRTGPFLIVGPHWQQQHMLLDMGQFKAADGMKINLNMFVKGEEELKFVEVAPNKAGKAIKVTLTRDPKFQGEGRQRYLLSFEFPAGSPPEVHGSNDPAFIDVKTNFPTADQIRFRVHFNAI